MTGTRARGSWREIRAQVRAHARGSAKRTIAAGQELRQPVVVDANDVILDRYRAACAAAGIDPLPDDQAAAMLAMVLAVLAGDDSGLTVQ